MKNATNFVKEMPYQKASGIELDWLQYSVALQCNIVIFYLIKVSQIMEVMEKGRLDAFIMSSSLACER